MSIYFFVFQVKMKDSRNAFECKHFLAKIPCFSAVFPVDYCNNAKIISSGAGKSNATSGQNFSDRNQHH
jgi:hypothetical protein